MAKGENQKFKFPYLMKIMLEKTDEDHALTMPQIIQELEKYDVSAERKSIYSDMEDMRDKFNVDLIKEQIGRQTYYYVGSRDFELAEVKLLIDAIQSSKFITERKSRELIKKIKGLVSNYQAQQLQRQVVVQGRIKTMNESIYYIIDDIHKAIAQNLKIRFKYFHWQADKSKWILNKGQFITVTPIALIWDDENYYLLAFDDFENKCKHYRVDKMLEIEITNEPGAGRSQYRELDMAEYSKATFSMYGGEKKRIKLHIHNKMAGVFIDRFGKDVSIRPLDEKHSEVTFDVYVSPQFYGWLFGLGKDVRLVGPADAVEEMRQKAREILDSL